MYILRLGKFRWLSQENLKKNTSQNTLLMANRRLELFSYTYRGYCLKPEKLFVRRLVNVLPSKRGFAKLRKTTVFRKLLEMFSRITYLYHTREITRIIN